MVSYHLNHFFDRLNQPAVRLNDNRESVSFVFRTGQLLQQITKVFEKRRVSDAVIEYHICIQMSLKRYCGLVDVPKYCLIKDGRF